MQEKIFFFEGSGGKNLLGMLHLPDGKSRGTGLVYCQPFAEERNLSHAISVRTAREIVNRAGMPVLRFDFAGCGDSQGDLTEASVPDWIEDIGRAADVLKAEAGVSRVGFWGLRSGSNLAVLQGSRRADTAFYVLWHPVADLKTYMNQFLRQRLSASIAAGAGGQVSVKDTVAEIRGGTAVEVLGYPVNRALFDSFQDAEERPWPEAVAHPALLVAVSPLDFPPEALKNAAARISERGVPATFAHVQAASFWDRLWCFDLPELSRVTVAWLEGKA